jgi:hypothetical protein
VLHAGDEAVLAHAWQRLADLGRPFSLLALRGEQSRWRWRRARLRPFALAPCARLHDLWPKPESATGAKPGGAPNLKAIPIAVPPDPQRSCDNFLRRHSRLGRHARRLAREGVVLRRHPGSHAELVRFIYQSKGSQATAKENLFREASRREFMISIAAEEGPRCEVFTYETNGQLISALVTFRNDDAAVRYFYTTYYDERWARFSPGQLLLFEASAISLAEGLDCDYLTGESLFKNRLATARVPLWEVETSVEEMPQLFPIQRGFERRVGDAAIGEDRWPRGA